MLPGKAFGAAGASPRNIVGPPAPAAHQVDLVGHHHLHRVLYVAVDVHLLHPNALQILKRLPPRDVIHCGFQRVRSRERRLMQLCELTRERCCRSQPHEPCLHARGSAVQVFMCITIAPACCAQRCCSPHGSGWRACGKPQAVAGAHACGSRLGRPQPAPDRSASPNMMPCAPR